MGLDMYLHKKYYVKNWEHTPESKRHSITILQGGRHSNIPTDKIVHIETEVAYWRKANAIHRWFVENVQDGVDNCEQFYVNREQLEELLETVTRVLEASELVDGKISNGQTFEDGEWKDILVEGKLIKDPTVAIELLPTQSGFFFGGTEYDQYYYEDLEYTKKVLEELLATEDEGEFYYESSW